MEGLPVRLVAARERLGLTQEAFSQKTGVPLSTLKKYEGGQREPGSDALAKFAAQGVNVQQLLIGDDAPDEAHNAVRLEAAPQRAGYAYIPLYQVAAKGGRQGAVVHDESPVDVLAFKEDWIRQELRSSPDNLRLIYVEGDSMEPDLRAGDIILVDQSATLVRREGVYVLRMDGTLLVKALQRLPGGQVVVKSRNALYEPFTLPLAELEAGESTAVIGRVVWACRRF